MKIFDLRTFRSSGAGTVDAGQSVHLDFVKDGEVVEIRIGRAAAEALAEFLAMTLDGCRDKGW